MGFGRFSVVVRNKTDEMRDSRPAMTESESRLQGLDRHPSIDFELVVAFHSSFRQVGYPR